MKDEDEQPEISCMYEEVPDMSVVMKQVEEYFIKVYVSDPLFMQPFVS